MGFKKILNSINLIIRIIFLWPLILYIYFKVQKANRLRKRKNQGLYGDIISTLS